MKIITKATMKAAWAELKAAIYGGLFLLYKPGFTILTILLTVYGFLRGTSDFHHWLCEDAPLKPAAPIHTNKPAERGKQAPANRRSFFDFELSAEPQTARR